MADRAHETEHRAVEDRAEAGDGQMRRDNVPADPTRRLLAIMARLRDPETGCEWDRAQDFASIAPYTVEEAYEVEDAIARAAWDELREELGDLLLQVVFHARMAEEQGLFAYGDVVDAICDKMEARHPHIFGGADIGAMDESLWEAQKAAERAAKGQQSAMDGVAKALPALMRAQKLQKRAAREGFDWPDQDGPRAKLIEEMDELAAAPPAERMEEAGDVLFSAVNLVRSYGISSEEALRAANRKFARRYRAMEALFADNAGDAQRFADLSLADKEALWQATKKSEKK